MSEETTASVEPVLSAANNTLSVDYWEKRWTDGSIGFHEAEGNRLLSTHLKQLVSENLCKKAEDLKIFVPLCGKTKDMSLFHEMGCTVVGVEYAPDAISQFFEENGLSNLDTSVPQFTKSSDGRLILVQGDLFTFADTSKLPFLKYDIIWDRGSFVAINENEREKYSKQMQSLLAEDGIHLLVCLEYDRKEYGGPPLTTDKKELEHFFGPERTVTLVDSSDRLGEDRHDRQRWIDKGLSKMTEVLYMMK